MMKGIIRTVAALVATVLFGLQCSCAPSHSAASMILMDADTGAVVYEHQAYTRSLVASTTKIMTAIVVLEHCDLDQIFTVPAEAVGIEGSSIYLKEGERITIRSLLYGLMLCSGNDAAVALALACSDSVPEFVDLMNLKAAQLNLKDTHFENPNGLDSDQHYSTASDLGKLTAYCLQNPAFLEIVSTKSIVMDHRCLQNHNKLLWSMEGCIGVKTGYTKAAGRILVSAAERKGRRLIIVTISDRNDWQDHKSLYDFGFGCYTEEIAIDAGQPVAQVTLLDGSNVSLSAAERFTVPGQKGDQLTVIPQHPKIFFQTGIPGSYAGFGAVFLGSRKIGEISLIWGGEANERTHTENTVIPRSGLPTSCGEAAS